MRYSEQFSTPAAALEVAFEITGSWKALSSLMESIGLRPSPAAVLTDHDIERITAEIERRAERARVRK